MARNAWLAEMRAAAHIPPRRSLAKEAANRLREFILLGRLAPGTAVSEAELAVALGISRTPMREALRILEREGLVEYSATRRAQIADPSIAELAQYITVLGALEALAGELCCIEASDAEINEIGQLSRAMQDGAGKLPALESFKLDMAFHGRIVEASRNMPLIETHGQYNARLWRARFVSSQRKRGYETTLSEHNQIAEALRRRDATGVRRALRNHHHSTIRNIKIALSHTAVSDGKEAQ